MSTISLIMAAGRGTRMGGDTHKCLTPVGEYETPFIVKQMEKLNEAFDISGFVIVVGHLSDSIQETLGDDFRGVPIWYVVNPNYSEYGSGWSLLKGMEAIRNIEYFDESSSMIVTEADCLIPTDQYKRLNNDWESRCLIGPNININKSVVVTVREHDCRMDEFVYDREHNNVLVKVAHGSYAIGESIQTWFIGNKDIDEFEMTCMELMENAEEADKVDWSNLIGFNTMLSKDMTMVPVQYDGTFINLNKPEDVELCNAQPWLEE
ncbi:hypothetical protein [Vibrio phage Va2]|nr:hypothetical protein [Vibrio phage Va2]